MNISALIGRVTHTPELKVTKSGKSVVSFTLAVKRPFSTGETDFIDCVAWNKQAEIISKYISKGHIIGLQGHIEKRNYTNKNNEKRYVFEVVVDNFTFLPQGNKPQEEQENDGDLEI